MITPQGIDTSEDTKKRILIVDDNKAIHEDFRKVLGRDKASEEFDSLEADFFGDKSILTNGESFDLEFALQGDEALEKVIASVKEDRPFSMAFVDVRMPPGWDGIETTQRLWEVAPNLQIVICTAYSDYTWEEMITKLGKTDRFLILKKPFDPVEVVQSAHALVRKSQLIDENRLYAESLELRVKERTLELESANNQLLKEVTERERSEEALRFTQFSVDNAHEGMFWLSPDSSIIYVNSSICQMLGYSPSELRALKAEDILPVVKKRGWEAFWNSAQEAGTVMIECRQNANDGSLVPVELIANYLARGDKQMLCVSSRDISKRKRFLDELSQARDAALESVRMKSRFLANMSHEIRTPMNGIIGISEILSQTALDREQSDQLNIIRSSADLLLGIINDILDSSKIESGNFGFKSENFNLHEALEASIDIVTNTARSKKIELNYFISQNIHSDLAGDSGRLRQLLTNLLSNAVKFTEQGEVTLLVLSTAETDTHTTLQFEIRDTGIGISENALPYIFDPFKQADDSDTRKYGGTGLGLTICRQIVEALGGTIGVESKIGEGSVFRFTLEFEKNLLPETKTPLLTDFPKDLRVIIVDHNATNREIIESHLANFDIRSKSAESGEAALELLKRENAGSDPFHLAILDMRMPGMNGRQLAKIISKEFPAPKLRIILLSSLGDGMDYATLKKDGAEAYLVKPVKQRLLQETLLSVLSGKAIDQTKKTQQPQQAQASTADSLSILLTEDNPVNCKVTLLQLKKLGLTADVAENGEEAVTATQEKDYDVILMDCQMPIMDGYEATKQIKKNKTNPPFIVAMTANAMEGDREKCLNAGMDDYVSKPISLEDLEALLRRVKTEIQKP